MHASPTHAPSIKPPEIAVQFSHRHPSFGTRCECHPYHASVGVVRLAIALLSHYIPGLEFGASCAVTSYYLRSKVMHKARMRTLTLVLKM